MAVTDFTFTGDDYESDPVAFSGTVKFICDPMSAGDWVKLKEELPDETYRTVCRVDFPGIAVILTPELPSFPAQVIGNYVVERSRNDLVVGYVEG